MTELERSAELARMWHKELLDKAKILDKNGQSVFTDREPKDYFLQQTIDMVRILLQANNCIFVVLPNKFTQDPKWDYYQVRWKQGELASD